MINNNPEITVFVSTRNRLEHLKLSLGSIEKQSFKDFEIVIVNDDSKDGTFKFLEFFKNNKNNVKVIHNRHCMGLAYNRNIGIRMAKGKYFTFLDDDDCLLVDALEKYFRIAKNITFNHPFFIIGGYRKKHKNREYDYVHNFEGYLKKAFIKGLTPPVASQFYPTYILRKINGYNPKVLNGVDHDLWIRLIKVNPYILSTKSATAIPNCGPTLERRMTFDFEKRRNAIDNNLILWRENLNLIDDFFYCHFKNSYDFYLTITAKQNKHSSAKDNYSISLLKKYRLYRLKFGFFRLFRFINILFYFKKNNKTFEIKVYAFPEYKKRM